MSVLSIYLCFIFLFHSEYNTSPLVTNTGVGPPHQKAVSSIADSPADSGQMSINSIQFCYYTLGESVRSPRMRAQSHKTASSSHFKCQWKVCIMTCASYWLAVNWSPHNLFLRLRQFVRSEHRTQGHILLTFTRSLPVFSYLEGYLSFHGKVYYICRIDDIIGHRWSI